MSDPIDSPAPYRVVYSGLVRSKLRALLERAMATGHGTEVLAAVKEMDRLLRIYPQVGDQLRDLKTEGETLFSAVFPPLYVRYVIDEVNRVVFVVNPIKPMPYSGL